MNEKEQLEKQMAEMKARLDALIPAEATPEQTPVAVEAPAPVVVETPVAVEAAPVRQRKERADKGVKRGPRNHKISRDVAKGKVKLTSKRGAKKPVGRPRVAKADRRTAQINMYLRPQTKKALALLAAKWQLSMTGTFEKLLARYEA